MTTNVLIAVGGTGAKVAEAIMHAAAAGLGPDTLRVGFVDQDKSNGNVTRAMRLLKSLTEARAMWRSLGSPHRIGDAPDGQGSDLLRTDIRPLVIDGELWVPHEGQRMTLSRALGDIGEDRHLYDALFSKGVVEQDMHLDEGYRGRAHVGSTAITARVDQDVDFWKALITQIRQSQGGGDVRLLLAGSVFGGTGAAGFPTLARLIRRRLEQENITAHVTLAGVLMLPYFSFDPPASEEGAAGNVARAEDLLIQSRGALKYYSSLFAQEHVFDELYLVGWNHPFALGYHSPGAGEQANPSLPPELLAALGACRFFSPDHQVVQDDDGTNNVFVSARRDDTALGWEDLPSPSLKADSAYEKLGRMLRFCAAFKHWGPLVAQPQKLLARTLNRDPWARVQGVDRVDYANKSPGDALRRMADYLDLLLLWSGSMQAYAGANRTRFNLWKINDLIEGSPRFDTPQDLMTIKPTLGDNDYVAAFNSIVIPKPGSADLPSANVLARRLSHEPLPGAHSGLGQMIAALHAYSAVTHNAPDAAVAV